MNALPEFDINAAQECVTKARGIAEMIGPYAIATIGYESAMPLCGAVWAITDELDKLAAMTGVDPEPEAES